MRKHHLKYKDKEIRKVGFLGFGKSSEGIFRYLTKHYYGLEFSVRAESESGEIPREIKKRCFGKDALSNIDEDILFLSPSAHRDTSELNLAKERGTLLSSDAEFFFENTQADVFCVTGSDGKSTTTYLTASLLSGEYQKAIPCGNYGEALTPHLDDSEKTAYVTELSSFQLSSFCPKSKRAVITNITENHIDWHGNFEEYKKAKYNVLRFSDEIILNYDDNITRETLSDYSIFGVYSLKKSEDELKSLIKAEHYLTLDGGCFRLEKERILAASQIQAPGRYNLYNYMAAILMSYGYMNKETLLELSRTFTGLKHRFETVGVFDGVRYINSSIDSTPTRTIATLSNLKNNVILILGGKSKGLDYSPLVTALKDKVKLLILVGENRYEIEDAFLSCNEFPMMKIPLLKFKGLFSGIDYAYEKAEKGDTVILSPASTSYDEFKNFEERGYAFSDYIKTKME